MAGSDAKNAVTKFVGEVAAAFRAQAMVWHPDLHHGLSPEELEECKQRFQRIMEAHSRLRRQHRQR